ncbi:uncharacterized protein DEA37_0000883 [Paragonimus westermani]|uniref:Uncharacterized protein n=1 Tax=Paragonimus westermani TaxID=34504 RepID=A0A5J4NAE5_9TREM|nr:uncharacterized protein DEA37_0000883 [Paragonimus westermani]
MPNTNLHNATGSARIPVQISDVNCMKVAQPLIHTHKQKRSTDRTVKRSRSLRSGSTKSVTRHAKKRKLSREKIAFEKKHAVSKGLQQKVTPFRRSKSVHRGLSKAGHIKAGSSSKASKLRFCKITGRTTNGHKTKAGKATGVKSRIRQYKNLVRKNWSVAYGRLRYKLGGSAAKSFTNAVSKSKSSSRGSKIQMPFSPRRSPPQCTKPTLRQAIIRAVAARVSQCDQPYCKASSNKPRTVSILWVNRLRPRPLKSARFACYSPSCFAQTMVTMPTSSLKKSRPKRVRFARKRVNLQCGKNDSNFTGSLIAMQREESRNESTVCVTDGLVQQPINYSGLANELALPRKSQDREAYDHPVVSTTVSQDATD